jgi:trehalose utilization protein
MGLIVLHSGHYSKIFKRQMGTCCSLMWREVGERQLMWVTNPYHPITAGLDAVVEIPHCEMYGEFFDVPTPDDVVFISWYEGGEVFRSGCTWTRGRGKIFYLQPGHETFPIYYQDEIRQILVNAARWAVFAGCTDVGTLNGCVHAGFSLAPIDPDRED